VQHELVAEERLRLVERGRVAHVTEARSQSHARVWEMLALAAVVVLTLLAGAFRLAGLDGPEGRLDVDEARLALAADGVQQTGLPTMPTGRLYPRGLLNTYLIAGSSALLGRHDFAVRLPSAVAGTLLVPMVFLVARLLGGVAAGLAAAGFVAVAQPLVEWSRTAWLPSVFLLLFTAAIYCWYRGFVQRQGRWQVAGGVAFFLTLLSYEFATLLLAALGLYLALEVARGRWDWYRGRPTLLVLGLVAAGLALFAGSAVVLRAGTLSGPLGEAAWWLSPRLSPEGAVFYLRKHLSDYYVLIGAALVGLPVLLRSRPGGAVFLGTLALLAFAVPSFVLQSKYAERYALPVLLLIGILAAVGTAHLGQMVGSRGRLRWLPGVLPAAALVVVFGAVLAEDFAITPGRLRQLVPNATSPPENWLQALQQELQPDHLIATPTASKIQYYLGRLDFYIDHEDYERYVYQAPDLVRQIHTDAVLLQKRSDFERLLEDRNTGRTVWVVGRRPILMSALRGLHPDLWRSLERSADRIIQTPDDWVMFKVQLPRRSE
jgi:4-amino-4-deoxy-L-arabinose transferase-like glycosyltransferase